MNAYKKHMQAFADFDVMPISKCKLQAIIVRMQENARRHEEISAIRLALATRETEENAKLQLMAEGITHGKVAMEWLELTKEMTAEFAPHGHF